MTGEVIAKNVLMMTEHVGTAESSNGDKLVLLNGLGRNMMVRHEKTGKTFSLSWHEFLSLAYEAGFDKED